MKTKRELFEKWYFDKHYAGTTACWLKVFEKFENLKGSEKSYNGEYINDRVLLAYEAWTASASREGYKLVPVETTAKQNREGVKKFVRHRNENTWSCDAIDDIYKAMIGAADEIN